MSTSQPVAFKSFILQLLAGEGEAWCEEEACSKETGAVPPEQQSSARHDCTPANRALLA